MYSPQKSLSVLIFSRKYFCLIAVLSVFLSACDQIADLKPKKSKSDSDSVSTSTPTSKPNARIACVGTSITLGEELPTEKNYPKQLQDLLGSADTVQNYGVSGTTILKKGLLPYWTESAYKSALQLNPGIVIIELGTNDSKSVNWQYKSEFKSDYIEFVRSFQALPSKPVVYICKPTPAFKAVYAINPDIIKNEINPLIDEVARETKVQVIDLYTPLVSSDALFRDGIHPKAEGAKMIAEIIRQAIRPN